MLLKNASVGGEFYVAPVYNEFVLAGRRVGIFPIEAAQMHGLGTPEEVERFTARGPALDAGQSCRPGLSTFAEAPADR